MLEGLSTEELARIRARYRRPIDLDQHHQLASQAVRDIRRLLHHISALEDELESLYPFMEEVFARERTKDEGRPD